MTPIFDRLPTSDDQGTALWFVGLISMLAALARILYGKDDLSWRRTLGSVAVALVVSWGTYGAFVWQVGTLGGFASVSIAVVCGLFTDDAMKRLRAFGQASSGGKRGND